MESFLSFALCSFWVAVAWATQDCNISGPAINNVPNGPVIVNTGSSGNTNGAGCDGCNVSSHNFEITWPADGAATLTGFGSTFRLEVHTGEISKYHITGGTAGNIGCAESKAWSCGMDGAGNISTMTWTCHQCQ